MKVLNKGEHIILKVETGEGLEYEITDNLVNPFQLVMTLSKEEVDEYER